MSEKLNYSSTRVIEVHLDGDELFCRRADKDHSHLVKSNKEQIP